ncbi:coat protein [Tomato necrotic streak virus]|uniref:Coat protein n=1 Tax=Tomato necrotic streak virus TaxID=1637492 RepID=A0A0E3GP22_9BROM|nr:coat protein [Tomato necrotic streak virus]AKA64362.1 coat protein [Tomato necrotic streak virus]AMN16532.1 coat protein [Tomato necrotic streak virus]
MSNTSNAIEVNGKWYSPMNNAPANRGGRRKPTARSRNWAQQQRSQPSDMMVGSMPIGLPTWKSFPGEQWHEVSGFEFPTSWGSGDIAYASMRTELGKIKTLHDTTKVYSVMYGFICKADGYAGFKDDFDPSNATGPNAPNRIRVKAGKYCARQMVFQPGTTVSDVKSSYNFVWQFDAAPAANAPNMVKVVKFYVSTTPLPGVKPPSNFLVCEE